MPRNDDQKTVDGSLTRALNSNAMVKNFLLKQLASFTNDLMADKDIDSKDFFFHVKGGTSLALYFEYSNYQNQNAAIPQSDWDTQIVINPDLPPHAWYNLYLKIANRIHKFLESTQSEFSKQEGSRKLLDDVAFATNKECEVQLQSVGGLELSEQLNSHATLGCTALHPLQYLDNALAVLRGEPEDTWANAIEKYYTLTPGDIKSQTNTKKQFASVFMNFSIPNFYLFRLLVRFRGRNIPSDKEQRDFAYRAELIDISIPRRDTAECLTQWHHTSNRLISYQGVFIPNHFYHLDEQIQMVRENLAGTSPSKDKLEKRLKRGVAICCAMNKQKDVVSLKEGVAKQFPKCKDLVLQEYATSTLHAVMLQQFNIAYLLDLELQLSEKFAEIYLKANKSIPSPIPDDEHFYEILSKSHLISQELENHMLKERTDLVYERHGDAIRKALIESCAEVMGKFDARFVIVGNMAARLHLDSIKSKVPCSVPTIAIDIYCENQLNAEEIAKLLTTPSAMKAETDGRGTIYIKCRSDNTGINYEFLFCIMHFKCRNRDEWPLLAYIKELPVMAPRALVVQYENAMANIEEFGASQRVQKIATELKKIVSQFW